MRSQKGITMIALVITIIVLIILAGVSILGAKKDEDTTIIDEAYRAQNESAESAWVEKISIEVMREKASSKGGLTKAALVNILEEYGELSTEANVLDRTLTVEDGTQIKVIEIYNGVLADGDDTLEVNVTLAVVLNGSTLNITANLDENSYKGELDTDELYYNYYIRSSSESDYTPITSGVNVTSCVTTVDESETYTVRVEVRETADGDYIGIDSQKIDFTTTAQVSGVITSNSTTLSVTADVTGYDGDATKLYYTFYLKTPSASDYEEKQTGNLTTYTTGTLSTGTHYFKIEVRESAGGDVLCETTVTKYFTAPQCFVAGTKVLTEIGMKNIEDVQIGDKVYSINLDNNQRELKEVTSLHINRTNVIYKITIGDEVVETTARHQFYIQDKGWIRAYDLETGDRVVSKDDSSLVIKNIEVVESEEPRLVYNLTVEGYHNYLVTEYELLVHNAPSAAP